ncbi:bifunctional protein FolD 4, chloroplastic-like [Silene latifolia]|uniref:bifunctional protein FolD 4, chloroplastic-like n=1 Tax=Silene latifolia TaxID=37657 RepID=UPI003D7841F1
MASMVFHDCCSSSTTARLLPLTSPAFRRTSSFSPSLSFSLLPSNNTRPSFPSLSLHSHASSTLISAKMAADSVAKVIDGKSVAKQIREEIALEITKMKDAIGVVPGLAVILVGDRKDSATYVRNKKKACEAAGINSFEVHLPETSTEEEVLDSISRFNEDPSVHGILVQLPLPSVRFSMCTFCLGGNATRILFCNSLLET